MVIGNVKEIIRYPVKSFHGEKINQVNVLGHGLYGDRSHGFMTGDGLRFIIKGLHLSV
ncbi:MOSC N-terminal beta barrel domain-containing protein [Metabacillus dongyingensis]|uniref:MOSC N-terminal beta barrel domain-containing protein n=1 Tax=Metabacillus dongyingensis TaxID=2874282 RepID=UPI003B8CBB8D